MFSKGYKLALASAVSCLMLGGCANQPHNNVLLFGTDTKIAFDVSTEATQGGMPEITLGYKRREAVWMPLARNNQNCSTGPSTGCSTTTATDDGSMYRGYSAGIDSSQGGTTYETDAYSVFASLGANFDGSANATNQEAKAGAGLAQFFATGIAAQRLGANPRVAEVLSVQPTSTAEVAAAKQEAQKAKDEAEELQVQAELGDKGYAQAVAAGKAKSETKRRESALIIACARLGTPNTRAGTLIDRAKTKTSAASVLKDLESLRNNTNERVWQTELGTISGVRRALLAAYAESC